MAHTKKPNKHEHIKLRIYAFAMYETIIKQMDSNIFRIITNTDMKHDFSINLKHYNTAKLEALPVQTHFDMSEGGESESDSDLPPLEDLGDVPEPYPLPEFLLGLHMNTDHQSVIWKIVEQECRV